MRRVAIISQTLRAQHCHAYMNDGSGEGVILTSNPSVFADFEFAVPIPVLIVPPPPELLPTAHLARNRIFRSALEKARSGSRFGTGVERAVKRLALRLGGLNRITPLRRRKAVAIDIPTLRSSAMFQSLEEEHRQRPIDRIVVFDVFDLPVALAFAETHGVEVLVR